MYKLVQKNQLSKTEFILYIDGDKFSFIPCVPENADYQQYLKWLEEGNTPLPADAE